MFFTHIKFFLRNLIRNKIYGSFSILSLSLGLVCCMLAGIYISHELSYERFFDKREQIARLEYKVFSESGEFNDYAILPNYYLPDGLETIPEIKNYTRLAKLPDVFFQVKNDPKITEKNVFAADTSFFKVFDFSVLNGDRSLLFTTPDGVVLTREMAEKYFGATQALGKNLTIYYGDNVVDLTVNGVIENVPSNSHLSFDILVNEVTFRKLFNSNLSDVYVAYQYLHLAKKSKVDDVTKKLNALRPLPAKEDKFSFNYNLQPISQIHLHSSKRAEIKPNSDIRYVYFFALIAGIILIVSFINFASLFLSQAKSRFKEINVRKVLGASSYEIAKNLLLESVLITFISFLIALLLYYFTLPLFNGLTGKAFTIPRLFVSGIIWKVLLVAIFAGFVTGLYPAFSMAYNTKYDFSGTFTLPKRGKNFFQHTIIITQFTASAVLIVGTIVAYNQLNYIWNKDLGFNKEEILTAENYLGNNFSSFKEKLSNNTNIQSITASSYVPGANETGGTGLVKYNGNEATLNWISVDYDFFDTYGIKLLGGRTFSKKFATDSAHAFIINESAIRTLGLSNPIGKQIAAFNKTGAIVGIVKDFNYLSLHKSVPPMLFLIEDDYYFRISIKISSSDDYTGTIAEIENAWYSIQPNIPFNYQVLENQFQQLYEDEENMGQNFFSFSFVAIFITCMGLFSIAAYSSQKRTREIGIRKVLGATVAHIMGLFYNRYFILVMIANLIAIPPAYYLLSKWLASFAFKIEIGFLPFLLSFAATIVFTLIAVSYWVLKAAYSNPVDAIKTE